MAARFYLMGEQISQLHAEGSAWQGGNGGAVFGPLPHPTPILEGAISVPLLWIFWILQFLCRPPTPNGALCTNCPTQEGVSLIQQTTLNANTMHRAQWRQTRGEFPPHIQISNKICWISHWQLSFHSQREKLSLFSIPLPKESIQLLQWTAFPKQCLVP